jgi:hypothetical protein
MKKEFKEYEEYKEFQEQEPGVRRSWSDGTTSHAAGFLYSSYSLNSLNSCLS